MFRLAQLFTFLLLLSLTLGCSPDKNVKSSKPDVFRVVVLPDRDVQLIKRRYQGLLNYLQHQTGINYQLIVPSSYKHALSLFLNKEADIAFLGGYLFVKAHIKANAVPLVSRDADTKFKSVIIVNNEVDAQSIKDLKGASFSFGSKLSTSGHVMPRRFLQGLDISPELFFNSIEYSGAHDKTALRVLEGISDAGVANAHVINNMFGDGRLNRNKVRILWRSPSYQDYVWAAQSSIDQNILNDIRDAFLNLSIDTPEHKKILDSLDATHFVPVGLNEFDILLNAVTELNM